MNDKQKLLQDRFFLYSSAGYGTVNITAAEGNRDFDAIWREICQHCPCDSSECHDCRAQRVMDTIARSLREAYGP